MEKEVNYIEVNRKSWNERVAVHLKSDFYDLANFKQGKSSLNQIELELLGDISGKRILHLQCHFGQDTISLQRMGAHVTGVDLSDEAIEAARNLATETNAGATFICCDIYNLPNHLSESFDIIFTSYGTIGWLPDLDKWAQLIDRYLKPGGKFVFAEFHPVVWMFDDNFEKVGYNYFKSDVIIETNAGTYADKDASITPTSVTWNHSLSEVFTSLMKVNLKIEAFQEYDYSPYNCFAHTEEFEKGKFRIQHIGNNIPMVYSLVCEKN